MDRILALLHAAALDDSRWSEAASLICEAAGARGSGTALVSGRSPSDVLVFQAHFWLDGRRREDWERRYFEDYMPLDERVPRVLRLPYGHVVPTDDLYTDREKKYSPAYNEALAQTGAQQGLHVRMEGPEGSHILWAVCDSNDGEGWGSEQLSLIERLKPHVRQCILVRHRLQDARALGSSLAGMLDSTRFGVIHLDRRGRIVRTNERALAILRRGDGLADRGGFLYSPSLQVNAELSQLLARALPPFGGPGAAGSMRIRRPAQATPLILDVNPVGADQPDFLARRTAALVLIVDPDGVERIDAELVREALNLTPAESALAVALAAGQTLRDIAESTGRREETVRWHLKQIFRKQGISRQVDLVRRVLALGGGVRQGLR